MMFKRRTSSQRPGTVRQLFHGVAIEAPEGHGCRAVLALSEQRYLAHEAPHFPLDNCDRRASCRCKYRHYSDRRSALRRETDIGLPPSPPRADDARTGVGRRVTDG
ncbi:MAG TPA: hypothetical protein VIZ30_06770 [Pseudomonadales bacterium]